MASGFDLIGDVHGQAAALRALLLKLGYAERDGAYRHAERRVIFLGDLVDRGPGQLETLRLVRAMRDAGSAFAVMGNHEFNAIAFTLPDPARPGDFLRRHHSPKYGAQNREQHSAFLREVEHDPALYADTVAYLYTLPLWLELDVPGTPGLRVVHACWQPAYMQVLRDRLGDRATLRPELMVEAMNKRQPRAAKDQPTLCESVERALKGPEVRLPEDLRFIDVHGFTRAKARQRWWDREAVTLRDALIVDRKAQEDMPAWPLPASARVPYPADRPLFIGHYGFTTAPHLLAPEVACVDWGAGRGARLCAYRWSGEARLSEEGFCCVPVNAAQPL